MKKVKMDRMVKSSAWKIVGSVFILATLTACDRTEISKNDIAFMNSVKQGLKHSNHPVSVSDIHSGDWTYVCASGMGADINLLTGIDKILGIPQDKIVVRNGAQSFVSERDDDSAITFIYPPNEIEIYRMKPDQIVYLASEGCVEKDKALFSRKRGKEKFSAETLSATKIAEDYIEVEIVKAK